MAEGGVPSVDVKEAAHRLGPDRAGAGALLVDVREQNEVNEVRVAGSHHVPLSAFQERFGELPKDRPLLVMCAAGKRSLVASEFLLRSGYEDVTNVDGGIIAWRAAGLPTESGSGR